MEYKELLVQVNNMSYGDKLQLVINQEEKSKLLNNNLKFKVDVEFLFSMNFITYTQKKKMLSFTDMIEKILN